MKLQPSFLLALLSLFIISLAAIANDSPHS